MQFARETRGFFTPEKSLEGGTGRINGYGQPQSRLASLIAGEVEPPVAIAGRPNHPLKDFGANAKKPTDLLFIESLGFKRRY